LYKAAKTRAEIDWLLGMNYTRAYTKKKGEDVLLSIGRCQTPILNLIVNRDIEIENFKSEQYWEVSVDFEGYKGKYIKDNDTKINKLEEAEKIKTETLSKGAGQVISVEKEEKKVQSPQLFNLTNLQKAMNKKFGFTAQKTLDVAQKLYEEYKILSYPRTSSRYLSQSFTTEFPERLECLEWGDYKNYIQKLDKNNLKTSKRFIDDTKITDHHALVPTKNNNMEEIYNKKLSDDEKKLFNEVTERFISCFYNDYIYESTIVVTEVNEFKHQFKTIGKKEIQMGWREIYSDGDEEDKENNILPDIKQGENKKISDVEIESKKKNLLPIIQSIAC
jgi:DNA topoisomerase-3